jgi:radical SAM superfamily enzyme YgiQ (UPF0313 family)
MTTPPPLDPAPRPAAADPHGVLLIQPFYTKDPRASFGKHVLTPALALTSLAGATPPPWTVRIWDENLLQGPPPRDPLPRVVGITVHIAFARRAYALADWYRKMGATVVLGGLHIASCPDEARPHADAIVIGEGMEPWPEILAAIEAGTLAPVYYGHYRRLYREQPQPRRELLTRGHYLTTASVMATRGCHNRCDFCYLSTRGVEVAPQVLDRRQVADVARAAGSPYLVFLDNNLGTQRVYLRQLCEALRRERIIWSAAISLDVTDDARLVREMALAGCTGVFVGFESLCDENIAGAGKRSPRVEDYARRVALLHEHGIQVNGSFVFGFDHDTPDVFDRTVEWIEENRLDCATLHILTPYPGTPLFERMEAEGRLLHRDWDRYDTAHCVFRPRGMTPEELEAGYGRAYRRLFGWGSIWRRRPAEGAAVIPYLAMTLLYKKSNWLWPWLIRLGLTGALWRPLVALSRARHLRFRRRLAEGRRAAPTAGWMDWLRRHATGH